MTDNYNKLTEAETERLSILIEECAEVQHAAAKVLRHGYDEIGPIDRRFTNRRTLEIELGHLDHIMQRMFQSKDLEINTVIDAGIAKSISITKYLHHQGG